MQYQMHDISSNHHNDSINVRLDFLRSSLNTIEIIEKLIDVLTSLNYSDLRYGVPYCSDETTKENMLYSLRGDLDSLKEIHRNYLRVLGDMDYE